MERFSITDVQAQAILDLRLARLTKLEVFKLEQELKDLKKLIKKLTAISKSGDLQLEVVKEEITEIKEKYPSPRRSKLVFNRDEADELVSSAPEKQPGVPCMLVYTADDKLKVLEGKEIAALQKAHVGKFKPRTVAVKWLETVTDKRIFAFTNYGNCHKLDIYAPNLQCKLSEEGVSLKDLSKDAEKDEMLKIALSLSLSSVAERLIAEKIISLFYPEEPNTEKEEKKTEKKSEKEKDKKSEKKAKEESEKEKKKAKEEEKKSEKKAEKKSEKDKEKSKKKSEKE
jgi:DNA gyrase/topoisomerase IV subunit A